MTIPLLDLAVQNWSLLFGNPLIFAVICVAVLLWIALVIRAPKIAVLIVLVPLLTAMAAVGGSAISIPRYVGVLVWIGFGAVFAQCLWAIIE